MFSLLSASFAVQAAGSEWTDLGTGFTGGVAVASNPDGRLEAFVRGSDNAVWHLAQTAPGSSTWSAAQSLGGVVISNPSAGVDPDGRLEVFAVGADHALWRIAQTTAGGATWSTWSSLGGQGIDDPAVGVNADGRLEVFIHTTYNSLWHTWQLSPGGSWAAGDEIPGDVVRAPSVGRNSDGRLILFVGDTDGKFWWIIQNTAGTDSWSPWWCLLGGTVNAPVVGTNADGRLELFAVRADNSVWTSAQTAAGSYAWTDWGSLGGGVSGAVSVAANADGRLEAFGTGADSTLVHSAQTAPGAGWSSWGTLGGTINGTATVARNSDGRLEAFAVGAGNILRHIAQSSPGLWTQGAPGTVPPVLSTAQPLENGASFVRAQAVAPGSLVAIFGDNFGSGLTTANFGSTPLATTLAGASVSFNGIPAPMIGVTGNQINAELPWELLAGGSATGTTQMVVRTAAGATAAATIPLSSVSPGFFSIFTDSTGVTRPAVYNSADGSLPWPSNTTISGYTTRPVKPNEVLTLFATGLGPVTNQPADGVPGLAHAPYSQTLTMPTVLAGGMSQQVIFSGLSPQYPSMYQVSIVIQPGTPAGDAVPLQIQMNGIITSDQLKIAISN